MLQKICLNSILVTTVGRRVMNLSSVRSSVKAKREDIAKRKIESANSIAKEILNSDAFNNSVLQLPEAKMDIERLLSQTIRTVVDPKNDFIDVLTNRGYRSADIRKSVEKLYAYITSETGGDLTDYEDKLEYVANAVAEKQELYVFIDLGNIRKEDDI